MRHDIAETMEAEAAKAGMVMVMVRLGLQNRGLKVRYFHGSI